MLAAASDRERNAFMISSVVRCSLLIVALVAASCTNIGLLEQLESPGAAGKTGGASCGNNCRIFVTGNTYTGNRGGPSGADLTCMNDIAKPSSQTQWKALLVSTPQRTACTTGGCSGGAVENFNWVLKPNSTYRLLNGSIVSTTNSSGIFNFPFTIAIGGAGAGTWTGLAGDWTQSSNCSGWTVADSTLGAVGDAGDSSIVSMNWTNSQCSTGQLLYCVEQ